MHRDWQASADVVACMPGLIRKLHTGARVLIHPCDECGTDNAPWGFFKHGQLSRWYCKKHREIGEAWLRGETTK